MSRRVTRYSFDFTLLRALVDEMSKPTDQRTPVSLTLDPATTEQLGILARTHHLGLVDMLQQVLRTELRKSVECCHRRTGDGEISRDLQDSGTHSWKNRPLGVSATTRSTKPSAF
jgi:hypothetical protein